MIRIFIVGVHGGEGPVQEAALLVTTTTHACYDLLLIEPQPILLILLRLWLLEASSCLLNGFPRRCDYTEMAVLPDLCDPSLEPIDEFAALAARIFLTCQTSYSHVRLKGLHRWQLILVRIRCCGRLRVGLAQQRRRLHGPQRANDSIA